MTGQSRTDDRMPAALNSRMAAILASESTVLASNNRRTRSSVKATEKLIAGSFISRNTSMSLSTKSDLVRIYGSTW
jgi:hypothetical protein